MTISILALTDTDQVRSIVGLSERDLDDAKFDPIRTGLELKVWLTGLGIDYATIISDGTTGSPTTIQTSRYDYLMLTSTYKCATIIMPRVRMVSAQKLGDGDNTMERFVSPGFDQMVNDFRAATSSYLKSLVAAIASTTVATVAGVSPLSGVAPGYDPVTGV